MLTRIEHPLGLGVKDSNMQDHMNFYGYVISVAVAHNSLGPGLNIAAGLRGNPLNSKNCLSNQVNVP